VSEKILVIIPALNAAGTVRPVIEAARKAIEPVVVINDGSSDATEEVARGAGATVLRHEVNRGKGAALKTGFKYALENGYDAVITLDADGQHLPDEIPKFIEAWKKEGGDLIIGSRRHLFLGMLPRRRNANLFSAWAISKTAGVNVEDSQSGFRLYSAKLLREITIHANGFDAESEVIVRAGRGNYRIVMLPIDLGFVNGISTSHYRPIADTVKIFLTVAKTRLFP
jgi:glycosyltransferase involved in cell wall biosynthesis